MASSRPLRKTSRLSTPLDVSMKDASTPEREIPEQKTTGTLAQGWSEPPLRNPAPSFEDYKGYERHGVLEHMAPLGSVPSQKVKLRVKNLEAPRRNLVVKYGDNAVAKEGVKTPTEPTPTNFTRRSDSGKVEDRQSRTLSSREKDDDRDYTPKAAPKVTTPKATSTNNTLHSTPSSRTSAGRVRLGQVVDSAVERSLELGNPQLGLAVKKLFEESLHNRTLADLLDAVLSQKPTPSQAADFQAYIKIARKQFKIEGVKEGSARRSSAAGMGSPSKSSSKSPTKSGRPSVGGENSISQDTALATGAITVSNTNPPQPPQLKSPQNGKVSPSKGPSSREEPPSKRIKRSRSSSISSSLSSLSSIDEPMESEDANTAETHAPTQPMTNLKAQLPHGPKLHTFSTTNLSHSSNKRPSVAAGPVNDDTAEEVAVKRRKLQKTFEDYSVTESSVRPSSTPKPPGAAPPAVSTAPLSAISRAQPTRLRNGTTRKHEYEELQSPASSVPGDLLVPPPLGASRGATPNQLGRPSKLVRKAARVKMSPIKKKSGVIAGMPRVGGGRDSPVGYGHMDDTEDHENNDYCSACGGSGQLLCCDGCTRSFHFTCLDPPMDPNRPPEGEWFCYICQSRKNPQPKWVKSGVFEPLLAILNKKNPVAYNLPVEIREYFEGVKTGEEGEYEEATTLKPRSKSGYDEPPDYYKLKDSKGNFITCFKCRKTAEKRPIIPCDFCSLQWHLDCVDPPLANPPYRANNNKPRTSWMCPNHMDRELSALNSAVKISPDEQPGEVKTRKVRRPKNARIVDTALRRGFTNNGLIEILNDPSDEEDETEREEMGVVYRLPEKGIKLDFIDRVKMSHLTAPKPARDRLTVRTRDDRKLHVVAQLRAQKEAFHKRSLADQEAALSLAQFAQVNTDLNLSFDQVQNLISTLIAEAPTDVVGMSHYKGTALADTAAKKDPSIPPSPPESDQQAEHGMCEREKQTLLMFQELIRRKLEGGSATTA